MWNCLLFTIQYDFNGLANRITALLKQCSNTYGRFNKHLCFSYNTTKGLLRQYKITIQNISVAHHHFFFFF